MSFYNTLHIFMMAGCLLCNSAFSQLTIQGTLHYDNYEATPLDGDSVRLKDGNNIIGQARTNAEGYFFFSDIGAGSYYLEANTRKEWGGVNAIDASVIARHYVELFILHGLRLEAADVDAGAYVNAIDGLLCMRRFVGLISSFPAGDWKFESPSVVIIPANVLTQNIKGICVGDVDGSYIPPQCYPQPSESDAGQDSLNIAGTSFTLTANTPVSGTGTWLAVSGSGGSFADPHSPTTIFTGLPNNTYTLQWTISTACANSADTVMIAFASAQSPASRDPYHWPFSQGSIWNMPIGSNAVYVPANIHQATQQGMFIDEDILVFNNTAPPLNIYYSPAAWTGASRCAGQSPILLTAPIPPNFIVGPNSWVGIMPNSCLAVLMPDGLTFKQTQPFAKCYVGSSATSLVYSATNDVNIFGDGILGAHGGSGLSSIGGTLRKEELLSPTDTIRHVLKINVFAQMNLSYSPANGGYRWPAIKADTDAATLYGSAPGANPVPQCRMGALMALPVSMNIDNMGFETIPGKILARAFQTYGAYIVDNTNWNVYAIATEWSPDGRFMDNFEAAWGFPFDIQSRNTAWARDMDRIFTNLAVIDNNTPFAIGGGGTPLAPLAPPFTKGMVEQH